MKRVITDRDLRVLRFLWKWKVSTTAFLHAAFFPDAKPISAYFRLNRLKKAGLLKIYFSDNGTTRLWGLTAKGFARIRNDFPTFEEEAFKPQSLAHDIKAQVVHLGVFDSISRENVHCISEQELRCAPEYIPDFAKEFTHKPDGYIIFNREKVIALEIELSHKSSQAYYDLAYKYEASNAINSVLWVVENESFARRILHQIQRFANGKPHKYSIIYYQHFIESGADCQIIGGNFRGEKLIFLLEKMGANRLLTNEKLVSTRALSNHKIRCW